METGFQEPSDFHEIRLKKRLQLAILYRSDPDNENRVVISRVCCNACHSERSRIISRRFRPALQADVVPLRYRHVKIPRG